LNVKKKFKEEKAVMETHEKKLKQQNDELRAKLEQCDQKFFAYKQEIENSPLNVLRNELA
jgi:Fe-S cluster biosynthesis and repair protein YggX